MSPFDLHSVGKNVLDFLDVTPGFGWIAKIIKFVLKKTGFVKDYEDLYRTDQKIKALGTAFNRIHVPIADIIKEEKLAIPIVVLFRQKGAITTLMLKNNGFVPIGKSMGLYALPPLQTIQAKIKDGDSLNAWLSTTFSLNKKPSTNIRFSAFMPLSDVFAYKHASLKDPTIFEMLMPHIIKYIGAEKSLQMTLIHYRKGDKKITERELIDQTPLLHIFADHLDNAAFDRLQKVEEPMLAELKTAGAITDNSYLSLSKITKNALKTALIRNVGNIPDVDVAIDEAIKQAAFMAKKL